MSKEITKYNISGYSFAHRVADFVCFSENGARKLAGEFEVSLGTVSRWCRGIAAPHPAIRAQIAKFIKESNE